MSVGFVDSKSLDEHAAVIRANVVCCKIPAFGDK